MRRVTLQGTDINVSRLSFGTASLHHLPTSRRRQDLLAAAFDHGFTHFDAAPYYGFGIAERELGQFLKARRGRVTITTKVGLYPPGGFTAKYSLCLDTKGSGQGVTCFFHACCRLVYCGGSKEPRHESAATQDRSD